MPGITTEWHECGVPTLALTTTRTDAISDSKALQSKIDAKVKSGIRIKELGRPIGYFKFIPPQILYKIFVALLSENEEGYGMFEGEYYGISGVNFSDSATIAKDITGASDDQMVGILLDLFPIIRVKSGNINGNDSSLPNIGYYTALEDSLYIKMPDLSGRDSNGYAQNIYGLGPDSDGKINFCFELVMDVDEYTAKAFDFQPPPVPDVKDGLAEFPEKGSSDASRKTEITILKEGLDKDNIGDYEFFLSPILPAGSSTSSRGFETTNKAVEIFTAPLLTKSYLTPFTPPVVSYPEKVVSKLIYEFSEKVQTGGMTGYNAVFVDTSQFKRQSESSDSGKLTHLEFGPSHFYEFSELGLPMSESLASLGIDSIADILGEANRPEILLGFRDGKGPEKDNEARIYDPKVYGARNLLASNRPNIILDSETQIPAMWIPLERIEGDDSDDFYTLEVPYKSDSGAKGARSSLEIYNEMGLLTFALYVKDHMGQFVRAPGENIRITPNSPSLEYIKPNGFAGSKVGNVPLNLGTTFSPGSLFSENTLTGLNVNGEGFVGAKPLLNIYSDEEGQNLVASLKDGMKLGLDQHELIIRNTDKNTITIDTKANFGDILPVLVGTYFAAVQLETGVTSSTIPI